VTGPAVLHRDDRRRGRADRAALRGRSINLALILKGSELRSAFLLALAAETLATLLLVVISSALTLVPQNTRLLGLEIAIVAGFSLALHGGGGFYWLAPAAMLGIVGAVYNAWVLLVEIVR
jgi:hypothetical protein